MFPKCQSRLGLGGAQFGMPYGITNARGQVPVSHVWAILDQARAQGIRIIDTAHLYGESEAVLGSCIGLLDNFDIITKTPKFAGSANSAAACAALESAFCTSLDRLRRRSAYALLVHDARDLLGTFGAPLWETMERLKKSGLVGKIGVSVYQGEEVDELLGRYAIDIVQVPFNAVDQRLVRGGQLRRLGEQDVEIHARSVFLQGLLLQPPERIGHQFAELREVIGRMHADFEAAHLTPLEGLLAAVFCCREISCFVVGVCSEGELAAICAAEKNAAAYQGKFNFDRWRVIDERLVNPIRWPELSARGVEN